MIKYTLLILAFAIACAIFYNTLEHFFGDSWVTVGIFCVVLIAFRTGVYFYRKSKGIKDSWPND